jgi:hypothetical protein
MNSDFLPGLPVDLIRAIFTAAPGNELASGKFDSPESSAALVANTFGLFLTRPSDMPPLGNWADWAWPPASVQLEAIVRFPWQGGRHPCLDVLVTTGRELIGIESKRYEPFRPKPFPTLAAAYSRPVWGERMTGYERIRDGIQDGQLRFRHLDATQLVKHAFGLRTAANSGPSGQAPSPVLIYLHAEPPSWPKGSPILEEHILEHRREIALFADFVAGDEVAFCTTTYREMLQRWSSSPLLPVREHVAALLQRFQIGTWTDKPRIRFHGRTPEVPKPPRLMNHSDFNSTLQRSFRVRSAIRRNVRLPSDRQMRICGDLACATIHLSQSAVLDNMQSDAAAFEGWSLVLLTWCGVQHIEIDWDAPADPRNGHYQRFLYRLGHFCALLGEDVVSAMRPQLLTQSRIGSGGLATLNVARGRDTAAIPSLPGSEADLEKRFAGASPRERAKLMAGLGLVRLDRQVPVGVFEGPPTRAGAIFTGGKSAIDLLGLAQDKTLWLLELKTARNIGVGSVSELFFYSMVLNDVRQGRIAFSDVPLGARSTISKSEIQYTPRIHARLLAENFHPLLTHDLFERLTAAASKAGQPIDYGLHDLSAYLDHAGAEEHA